MKDFLLIHLYLFFSALAIPPSAHSPINQKHPLKNHQFSTNYFQRILETQLFGNAEDETILCDVVGCRFCSANNICAECVDEFWAHIENGKCLCSFSDTQKPDSQGFCADCLAHGCASCIAYNEYQCFRCEDKSAYVEGGQCVCEGNKKMDANGKCSKCEILGCSMCDSESKKCLKCTDQFKTQIQNGECACTERSQKLNQLGQCQKCIVLGCQQCLLSSQNLCVKCQNHLQLQSGKCQCPNGKTINSEGQCSKCDVLGCDSCEAGFQDKCYSCIDQKTNVINGVCSCIGQSQHLNSTGYCVKCLVLGCKECDDKGEKCLECIDQTANIQNGHCVCGQNQRLNSNGICEICMAFGCELCVQDNNQICQRCLDQVNAKLLNGQCSCKKQNQSLNFHGYCDKCTIQGCLRCENPTKCHTCLDPQALLDNGKCLCQQQDKKINEKGYCTPCNISGCGQCKQNRTNYCHQCLDEKNTQIVNGFCQCYENLWIYRIKNEKKPNQKGICSNCFVQRCASCLSSDPNVCYQCFDPDAQIVNGACQCPPSKPLNMNGFCSKCNVPYCLSCLEEREDFCLQCQEDKKLEQGKCICALENKKINQKGICQNCFVNGCNMCLQGNTNSCQKCNPGLNLRNGQCICSKSSEKINENSNCGLCLVNGCKSCASPYHCLQCQNSLALINGLCVCQKQEQKKNKQGKCSQCLVDGCSLCEDNNPNYCLRCLDCQAFLIEGKCHCFGEEKFNEDGFCSRYSKKENTTPQKLMDKITPQCCEDCAFCQKSQCKNCSKGYYLSDNICYECTWPCIACESGDKCTECREGWTLKNGNCYKCKARNCASCDNIEVCDKCKNGYEIESDYCISKLEKVDSELRKLQEMGRIFPNFQIYLQKYKKQYDNKEYERRKTYYETVVEMLEEMREDNLSIRYSINHMSDWSPEEKSKLSCYHPVSGIGYQPKTPIKQPQREIPQYLNWTARQVVTNVKDQGLCGGCWAFGTIAGAESTLILSGQAKRQIDLSEKQLISCTEESNCDGTFNMKFVLDQVKKGLLTQQNVALRSDEKICSKQNSTHISDKIFSYYNLKDEEVIALLQNGPLICALSNTGWIQYQSGIFKCPSKTQRNHIALLVGYDEDYWLIKNSWGQDWGELGYIRITRDPKYNCLIGSELFQYDKVLCTVPGCYKCFDSRPDTCLQCIDDESELIDGICVCKEPAKVFSEEGFCASCEVIGCESCQVYSSQKCQKCLPGLIRNEHYQCMCDNSTLKVSFSEKCESCQVNGCLSCTNNQPRICSRCLDCMAYIENGLCTCPLGYRMDDDGVCVICEVYGCEKCDENQCISCGKDKQMKNGQCVCKNEDKIIQFMKCVCPFGFKERGNACIKCETENCLKCYNFKEKEICQLCGNGKILVNNKCSDCPLNGCEKCVSETICSKCIDKSAQLLNGQCICPLHYNWPNSQGYCENCFVPGCDSCQKNNPYFCNHCIDNLASLNSGQCECPSELFLSPEGFCYNCSVVGCEKCSEKSSQKCEKCFDKDEGGLVDQKCVCYNYTMTIFGEIRVQSKQVPDSLGECAICSSRYCVSCISKKPSLCYRCLDHTAIIENGVCTCQSGFEFNISGYCQEIQENQISEKVKKIEEKNQVFSSACQQGCRRCFSLDNCVECLENFYLVRGKCKRCHTSCKSCFGSEKNHCLSCHEQYYIKDRFCEPCSKRNCLTCNENKCFDCKKGYFLHKGKCSRCSQYCTFCSSMNQCKECKYGYALTNRGKCIQCLSSCNKCSFDNFLQCDQCDIGFYLDNKKKCEKCSQNCQKCSQSNKCTVCQEGYELENGKCRKQCKFPCKNCLDNLCLVCQNDYKLLNGFCEPVISCNEQKNCSTCPKKYTLKNNFCLKCQLENCEKCESQNKCSQCKSGYMNNNETCFCNEGCIQCSSSENCTKCSDNYFLLIHVQNNDKIGTCQKCQYPCKKCVSTAEKCMECVDGYVFLGWKCVSQKRTEFLFKFDTTVRNFIENIDKFKEFIVQKDKALLSFENITINSIQDGSVTVKGSIYYEEKDEEVQKIVSDLKEQSYIADMKVLESNLIENYERKKESNNTNNIPMIIGIVVGGSLFLLIVILLIVLLIKRQERNEKKEEKEEK